MYPKNTTEQLPQSNRNWALITLLFLGLLLGILAREPLLELILSRIPSQPPLLQVPPEQPAVAHSPDEILLRVRQRAAVHLNHAGQECQRLLRENLITLDGFFEQAKRNPPAFAEDVLGWGSKWRLLTDHVSLVGSNQSHEKFLKECFRKHLFTPEDLEKVIRQLIENYLQEVNGVESLMLVKIRQDMDALSPDLGIGKVDQTKLQAAFEEAMRLASTSAGAELRDEVIRQLVSLVTVEVLTQGAMRMGVSAGLLGAGAGSGWATFGVGVVVGVVVDQVVSWVWNWMADPQGEVVQQMKCKLDELHQLILNGGGGSMGLQQRLEQLNRDRNTARRAAVLDLINRKGEMQ